MGERKMGPREAQLFAMRESRYRRAQAMNAAAEPAPKLKKIAKKTAKKKPKNKKGKT